MQCNNCGHEIVAGAEFCGNCGAKLVVPSAPATPPQPSAPAPVQPVQPSTAPVPVPIYPGSTGGQPATAYAVPLQRSSGKSVASMVLGIVSVVTCFIWFVSLPLAITAIILGFLGRGKGGKGMAITGIITGVIGIIASILVVVAAVNFCNNNTSDPRCSSINNASFVFF